MEQSRSVVVKKFGGYEVLRVEQFELPSIEGRIEVRVEYGGVNFADLYTRQGLMPHKLPFVLGMEAVGTITALGKQDTDLKVGQRVICYDYHCGMFRDTVRVTPDKCYPLPESIGFKEGAAIFVNYLTAYFSIIELGSLKKNESILILSCAGGVGSAATQLAKTIQGVTVLGTASPEKHSAARENGVDLTLTLDDKIKENVLQHYPKGVDLILSTYAGPLYGLLESLLKPLGRIVLIGANNLIQNEQRLSFLTMLKSWWTTKNVSLERLIVENRAAAGLHLGTLIDSDPDRVRGALKKIFEMIEVEELRVKVYEVVPMTEVVKAVKFLAERKNVGKVLISMRDC